MAPIVAPGIVRYTLSGTLDSNFTWANIWDVDILASGSMDRPEAIADYAQWLVDSWISTVATATSELTELTSVSWVDLDSLTGSTGVLTSTVINGDAPWPGEEESTPFPANTSVLVTKNTTGGGRGTRPGRLYMIGADETQATAGSLIPAYQAAVTTIWQDFLAAVTEPSSQYAAQPVVVHTRNEGTAANPDIVYAGNSDIASLSVQTLLATQRRRLRR